MYMYTAYSAAGEFLSHSSVLMFVFSQSQGLIILKALRPSNSFLNLAISCCKLGYHVPSITMPVLVLVTRRLYIIIYRHLTISFMSWPIGTDLDCCAEPQVCLRIYFLALEGCKKVAVVLSTLILLKPLAIDTMHP